MRFSFFFSPKVAQNWNLLFFKYKSCSFPDVCSFDQQQQTFHGCSGAKALNVEALWSGWVSLTALLPEVSWRFALGVFWKPSFLLSQWMVWPGNQSSHTSLLTSLHPFCFTKYLFLDVCPGTLVGGQLLMADLWRCGDSHCSAGVCGRQQLPQLSRHELLPLSQKLSGFS